MKKIVKSVLAITAAVAMMSSLAACGGGSNGSSSSKSEPKHLTITWWGNQTRNDNMAKINKQFEKDNAGTTIDGQFFDSGSYFKKLATSAAGGKMPDIIQIGGAEFRQYSQNGLLLDLSDYVKNKKIDLSKAPKDVQTLGELDGKIIGVPTAVASPAFIYDKNITDKAGVTISNNMTIDQFEAASKTIQEKTGYKTNMYYLRPYEVMQYMMRGRGKHLFDGNKLGVTVDDLTSYFKIYEDGIKQGWHMAPEDFASLSIGSVEQDPLVYGSEPSKRSWCTFDNSSTYSSFTKLVGNKQNLQLAPWPSKSVKKSEFLNYSQLWVISKKCKNPELAAKWINDFVNNEASNKVRLTDRGMPISTSVVKTITPLLSDSDKQVAKYISDVVTPNSSKAEQIDPAAASPLKTDTLPQIEEQVLYGKISSKDAAKQFYDKAQEMLASGQ